MDAVANYQRPLCHGNELTQLQAKFVQPRFIVTVFDERVSLRIISEGINGRLEYAKVLLCPRDLEVEAL